MKKKLSIIFMSSVFSFHAFCDQSAFVVNPETIRNQLFSKNISLLQALNNVQNSKLNVSNARAKLLPSINLAILLPALANPTFLLGSVTFLFPFLVPSNWATLRQQAEAFEADKASYKALQLNILSNSLSLYYTYLNDLKVQTAFVEQSDALGKLYTSLKKESDLVGNISIDDLNTAFAQWEESKIKVSKLQELLIEEKTGMRTLLGLPLGSELKLEEVDLLPSSFEDKTSSEISTHSMDVAPEVVQMNYLIKAAKAGKFSKVLGFQTSASIGGTSTNGSSPFDSLKASGGFTFGMDNLVNIKIASNNIDSLILREEQLKQENEKTSEIIIGKFVEVKNQKEYSTNATQSRSRVYESQKKQYRLGLISLQDLLLTEAKLTDAKVADLKIDLDFKMQRLTLQRLVVDGDFSKVKGCESITEPPKKGLFGFKKQESLDKVCK
jgi:outer membrane protein TolC